MTLAGQNRYDYAPVTERPAFEWPKGKGLPIYPGINLEHFAFGEGLGAELVSAPAFSDLVIGTWLTTAKAIAQSYTAQIPPPDRSTHDP